MGTLTLLLAGDVMTGRGIDQIQAQPGDPGLYESWVRDARDYVRLAARVNGAIAAPVAPGYIWGEALAEMDRLAPALRIVNLETAVTRSGEPWPGKGIHYRMHPANLGCLTAARLDACVLANNHVLDWGLAGLDETLATLAAAGLAVAGAGQDRAQAWAPALLSLTGGGRLLLFSFATPSGGAADVVHGHSSHHPLPVQVWCGKVILYGCGDLINDYEGIGAHGRLRSDLGCLYGVTLDGAGMLQQLEIVPLQLRQFRLGLPEPAGLAWLQEVFEEGGRAFRSGVRATPEGRFRLRWQ